jgi:signal transduction histidine kinase
MRETPKFIRYIQDLDQLVRKSSLGREINKEQMKKLLREEKERAEWCAKMKESELFD